MLEINNEILIGEQIIEDDDECTETLLIGDVITYHEDSDLVEVRLNHESRTYYSFRLGDLMRILGIDYTL